MHDDPDLSGQLDLRLFPLPGVVFFPHSILPLHIFEPRYRQMTEDALAGDRLITMVMARPDGGGWRGRVTPNLEEYACVGRILRCEQLPDGRYNFLLLGLKRVRLIRELDLATPYRVAQAEVIEEAEIDEPAYEATKLALVAQFRAFLARSGGIDPELDEVLQADLPLGIVCDILGHSLGFPPPMKQQLLAQPAAPARADLLGSWLGSLLQTVDLSTSPSSSFPPRFSEN